MHIISLSSKIFFFQKYCNKVKKNKKQSLKFTNISKFFNIM